MVKIAHIFLGQIFQGRHNFECYFFGATDFQIQGGLQFLQILQVIFGWFPQSISHLRWNWSGRALAPASPMAPASWWALRSTWQRPPAVWHWNPNTPDTRKVKWLDKRGTNMTKLSLLWLSPLLIYRWVAWSRLGDFPKLPNDRRVWSQLGAPSGGKVTYSPNRWIWAKIERNQVIGHKYILCLELLGDVRANVW